jgi:hypothetical protein
MMTLSKALYQYNNAILIRHNVIKVYKNDPSDEAHMIRVAMAQLIYLTKLEYAKQFHGAHFDEMWNRFEKVNREWVDFSYSKRPHTRQFIRESIRLGIIRNLVEKELFVGL